MISSYTAAEVAKIEQGAGMFYQKITAYLADGTSKILTNENLLGDTGIEIEDATSSQDHFDIGSTIINVCRFTIANYNGDWDGIDFMGARLIVQIGVYTDRTTPTPQSKGVFYVVEQKVLESAIQITAYDAMSKFDKPYSLSSLTYPAVASAIVMDACSVCGVSYGDLTGLLNTIQIPARPADENTTFRQVISWIAQMAGLFARMDRMNLLQFSWYDTSVLGDDDAAAGTYHDISSIFSKQVSANDITITGFKIVLADGTVQTTGTDDYMLEISGNEFINSGNVSAVLTRLGNMVGMTFRKIEVSSLSDPRMEAGDVFRLTIGSDHYWGVMSYAKFCAGANQVCRSDAAEPVYVSAARQTELTRLANRTVQEIAAEADARQTAIEHATDMITGQDGGNYIETLSSAGKPTGWAIMDTESTATATNVWRFSSGGLGHSHSGWNGPYDDIALTADGKINADMITVGTLRSIQIVNGSNGEFTVDANGNVVAKSINIQGGSINITTQTDTYDVITLRWINTQSQYVTMSQYAPLGLTAQGNTVGDDEHSASFKKSYYQAGGIWLYQSGVKRYSMQPTGIYAFDENEVYRAYYGHGGWTLKDSSGVSRIYTTNLYGLYIRDDQDVLRFYLEYGGWTLKDSSGVSRIYTTTTYGLAFKDSSGVSRIYTDTSYNLALKDNNDVLRATYQYNGIFLRDTNGNKQTALSSGYLGFYDTDGTTLLGMLSNAHLELNVPSGEPIYLSQTYSGLWVGTAASPKATVTRGGIGIRNASTYGVTIDGVGKLTTSGAWDWRRVTSADNRKVWLPSYVETAETPAIPANADLNTYLTNGNYYCSASNAAGISNTPYTAGGFLLHVDLFAKESDTDGLVVQTLYPDTGNSVLVRRWYGTSFEAWREYVGSTTGILPIANGGTGASTVAGASNAVGLQSVQIAGGASATFDFAANGALVFAKRGTTYLLALIDYFTAGVEIIASNGTVPTLTHTADTKSVTVQNNLTTALFTTVISVRQS